MFVQGAQLGGGVADLKLVPVTVAAGNSHGALSTRQGNLQERLRKVLRGLFRAGEVREEKTHAIPLLGAGERRVH
ncbi:hypothetical protein TSH7_24730 [Azospirillum sp. TSH7]|nr:hypothetical protein TSH7_24730 [Azospirillum sp. TSH7]PWC66852.1 hypothetical protein TSH20_14130 [Azospirillum sp. TSH20]